MRRLFVLATILFVAPVMAGSPGIPVPSVMVRQVAPASARFTTQTVTVQVPKTVCVDEQYEGTVMVPATETRTRQVAKTVMVDEQYEATVMKPELRTLTRRVPQTVMVDQQVQVQVPVPQSACVTCEPQVMTQSVCQCVECTCVGTYQQSQECVDCQVDSFDPYAYQPPVVPRAAERVGCLERFRLRRAERLGRREVRTVDEALNVGYVRGI